MSKATDPFERAVEREKKLRDRASVFDSPSATFSFMIRFFAALAIGWIAVLAGHWVFLAEPRWLVVAHTVVFALVAGYALIVGAFFLIARKRRPDLFGEA